MPPRRSRTGLWVALAALAPVVVLGVAAVVVLVATRGPGDLEAGPAARNLAVIVDSPEVDPEDGADLVDCPLGDVDDVVEVLEETVDLPRLGDGFAFAFAADEATTAGLLCGEQEDADPGAAVDLVATFVPAGDYEDALDEVFPGNDVDAEAPVGFRGGQVHAYCVEGEIDGCGADWVADDVDLVVGIYASEAGVRPGELAEVLRQVLPDLLDALAEAEVEFTE